MKVLVAAFFSMVMVTPSMAECYRDTFESVPIMVCAAEPAQKNIRLFLDDANGKIYGGFSRLKADLERQGKTLVFAFNAGMYHKDLSPVGLYIEDAKKVQSISTKPGSGNFHMLPNGVFWIDGSEAGVTQTQDYITQGIQPQFATQSGPMLVINNALHPQFLPQSKSRKIRNGVGVRQDGKVIFALSERSINFHRFARYFRDILNTSNALYLDGTISSAYIPGQKRFVRWFPMGPIVGVVGEN